MRPGLTRDRIKSAIGVAAFHILLGYGLITGLRLETASDASDRLKVFDVPPELPPPVEEVAPGEPAESEAAPSPPNLAADRSPIVAPPPEVRLAVPPPVAAAPTAGTGSASTAGASDTAGPGTGSGGAGTGRGGGGAAIRARRVRGRLSNSDYPRALLRAGVAGTVYTRIAVAPDGRVGECMVTQSSGNAELDAITCRLIERRFRYAPARDAQGRPVWDVLFGTHNWRP